MRKVIAHDGITLTLPSTGQTNHYRVGDVIGISPAVIHYNEEYYPNPTEFKYSRFLDEHGNAITQLTNTVTGTKVPLNQCFLPFGGGSHYCPGRKFARNEIKTFISYLLLNFNMELDGANPNPNTDPNTNTNTNPATPSVLDMYDGSRAGLGVFPPKHGLPLNISPKW